jgi:peptidyl-prolyl cis-trans isomerase-like 4
MSVYIVTSAGEMVVDLFVDECPTTCLQFLKLCKIGFYRGNLFHSVHKNWLATTGDPTGTGQSEVTLQAILDFGKVQQTGWKKEHFQEISNSISPSSMKVKDEISPHRSMNKKGLLCCGSVKGGCQFFITLRDYNFEHLQGHHTIFGEIVVDDKNVLDKIDNLYVDNEGRPYQEFRMLDTYILHDPFEDFPEMEFFGYTFAEGHEGNDKFSVSQNSKKLDFLSADKLPLFETIARRVKYDLPLPGKELTEEEQEAKNKELEMKIREKDAHSRAMMLEVLGDLPDADAKPPEEALFVCKLNPITRDEDLELIFSRFGKIQSCSIVKDYVTKESLCYGFVIFETVKACEVAYEKMNNVLIDDRRIKVDFSQSVSSIFNKHFRNNKVKPKGGENSNGPVQKKSRFEF